MRIEARKNKSPNGREGKGKGFQSDETSCSCTRSSCAQSWSAFFRKGWRLEEALQAQLGKGKLTLRGDGIVPHRHILEVENLTRRG